MDADDWYRNSKWNREIEEKFFSKLSKARSQRDQYLVIQALTLVGRHPEVTHQLVDQYFEYRKDKFEDVRALLARANAFMVQKNVTGAMQAFRTILDGETEFPKHQTTTYVDYPYIVAMLEISEEYANAIKTLEAHKDRLMFPLDRFKWHAAMALIKKNREHASEALGAAQIEKSGFRFHQKVGLVGKDHAKTIRKLRKFCT